MIETSLKPIRSGEDPPTRRDLLVGLAAAAILVGLLGFLSRGEPDLEPGPISSFEAIAAGTYQRQTPPGGPPWYAQFLEDGTYHLSSNRGLVVDRPQQMTETMFEGTKVFLNEMKGVCDDNPDAIYEIHLLENGNLQFVAIEDPCPHRSSEFQAEWEPVP